MIEELSANNAIDASSPILIGRNISKSYGENIVLKDISLTVMRNETHAIIGPNGAGKTTLFKILSGEILADNGHIEFDNEIMSRYDGFKYVQRGVGRTFQVARVFSESTVFDNILVAVEARFRTSQNINGSLFKIQINEAVSIECKNILTSIGLVDHASSLASELPYSDRKRLELGMVIALRPRLLMLDEPMAGISPHERREMVDFILRITHQNKLAMLLTEHDMSVVLALADRLTVMNYGEIVASGPPHEIRNLAVVRDIYLGREFNA